MSRETSKLDDFYPLFYPRPSREYKEYTIAAEKRKRVCYPSPSAEIGDLTDRSPIFLMKNEGEGIRFYTPVIKNFYNLIASVIGKIGFSGGF